MGYCLGTWRGYLDSRAFTAPCETAGRFPRPPDLQKLNPDLRTQLSNADQETRRKPASAELVGKLGMVYHANLLFEQAVPAYRIAARLAPRDFQWVYAQALLQEEVGQEIEKLQLLQQTLKLNPDYFPALLKLADWLFKRRPARRSSAFLPKGCESL